MDFNQRLLKREAISLPLDAIWEGDFLGRKKVAVRLTEMLSEVKHPFVVCIDGGYGSGKSFLLKRWEKHLLALSEPSPKVVYFNVWENEFCNNALFAFISKVQNTLFPDTGLKSSDAQRDASKAAGKVLLKRIAFNLLEKVTLDIIKREDFKDADEAYEKAQPKIIGLLEDFSHTESAIEEFKTAMAAYSLDVRKTTNHPVYILVDELDRCRPLYAIEVLETIKHFFEIDNFVFILGVDRKQLEASITRVYGDIDTEAYLRKFIDYNYKLDNAPGSAYISKLVNEYQFDKFNNVHNVTHICDIFVSLKVLFNLKLREIEQYLTEYRLLLPVIGDTKLCAQFLHLLALLLVLRTKHPQLYYLYAHESQNHDQIIELLFRNSNGEAAFADAKHVNEGNNPRINSSGEHLVAQIYSAAHRNGVNKTTTLHNKINNPNPQIGHFWSQVGIIWTHTHGDTIAASKNESHFAKVLYNKIEHFLTITD